MQIPKVAVQIIYIFFKSNYYKYDYNWILLF